MKSFNAKAQRAAKGAKAGQEVNIEHRTSNIEVRQKPAESRTRNFECRRADNFFAPGGLAPPERKFWG
jgi:hypothetical protein